MIATALTAFCHVIAQPTVHWGCDPNADVQRIYFGNHTSHLDFLVTWSALPPARRRLTRPVAGGDYWNDGFIRRYVARHVFDAVLVERRAPGSPRAIAAARASVDQLVAALGTRHSLIVFPEGTRSETGEVGRFKSGLYRLARLRPDVELVPVYLENLNRILPKGECLPVPGLSRVIFGPALAVGADADKHTFLEKARTAVIDLRAAA
jgi:1-acyl-sn-glycerol-3-phosphate acyltransferase